MKTIQVKSKKEQLIKKNHKFISKFLLCDHELKKLIKNKLNLNDQKIYFIKTKYIKKKFNLKDSIMALSLNAMNWANDYGAQRRVKYFMQKAAIAVLGEASPIGDEHVARVSFASKVLDETASISEYTIGVVTNPTIASTVDSGSQPSDNDIEFAVNSMFSDFAGWDQ